MGLEVWFIVGGDCVVEGFVYGFCNDIVFEVLGMLCVCVVVIDDYVMYVEDGMIVMYVFILLGVNWEV